MITLAQVVSPIVPMFLNVFIVLGPSGEKVMDFTKSTPVTLEQCKADMDADYKMLRGVVDREMGVQYTILPGECMEAPQAGRDAENWR